MRRARVIPVLGVIGNRLVKTKSFKNPKYIGDPVNAIKIFNDKEVDEIALLDIRASTENKLPNYKLIDDVASECFMPLSYGGGVNTFEQAKQIFSLGVEKIILNSAAISQPKLISKISEHYGSQSVVVCMDVKKSMFNTYNMYIRSGQKKVKGDIMHLIQQFESLGAGEIIIHDMVQEGTFSGYNIPFIKSLTKLSSLPIIALGGLSSEKDMVEVIEIAGASAVGGSSYFVFAKNNRDSILITYPKTLTLKD